MSYASICSFIKMASLSPAVELPDPVPWSTICRRRMSAAAVFNLRPNLNTGKSHKAFPQCNVRTARCIRINGRHFVLTHTHRRTFMSLCMCVCVRYMHQI